MAAEQCVVHGGKTLNPGRCTGDAPTCTYFFCPLKGRTMDEDTLALYQADRLELGDGTTPFLDPKLFAKFTPKEDHNAAVGK